MEDRILVEALKFTQERKIVPKNKDRPDNNRYNRDLLQENTTRNKQQEENTFVSSSRHGCYTLNEGVDETPAGNLCFPVFERENDIFQIMLFQERSG